MTKECTLKEAFIEAKLNEFQPSWRDGEDITKETKQKIKDYVREKVEFIEGTDCITDFSIWHMAKKIREREGLPSPVHSNKGNVGEDSKHEPDEDSVCKAGKKDKPPLKRTVKKLLKHYTSDDIIETIETVKQEQVEKDEHK